MTDSFNLPEYFASRDTVRQAFLAAHGYDDYHAALLYEDMASRRFYRLQKGGARAVLMDSLPDSHPHATRGHRLHDYIRLSAALRQAGVHAPDIYAADEEAGFIVMEDLGDTAPDETRFEGFVDVLITLRTAFDHNTLALPDYFRSHIHAAHRRVIDWYLPSVRGRHNEDGLVESYQAVWQAIEADMPEPMLGFVHADFHRGNLRLTGAQHGVLDFQGAQWGPLAYDLVNLLEDARVATPPALKRDLKDRYLQALSESDRTAFERWYIVLSAQFHCRAIGQFIKLALVGGKPRYLDYIPLLQAYLREELAHPMLAPLARWFAGQGVDFTEAVRPDARLICPDAY